MKSKLKTKSDKKIRAFDSEILRNIIHINGQEEKYDDCEENVFVGAIYFTTENFVNENIKLPSVEELIA